MKRVMIDWETLGNGKRSCPVQIGACYFELNGEIYTTFKENIDAEDALKYGCQMDASTVYWWLKQSKEAQASITAPGKPFVETMMRLNAFLADADEIWSHATFDFVILQELIKLAKLKPAYKYQGARDIRTLMAIAKVDAKKFPREGVHHDGLDDAVHQAKYVAEVLRQFEGRPSWLPPRESTPS